MGKTTNADKIISRRKSPRTVKRAPKRYTDDRKPKSTPTKKRHSLDSDDIRINTPKRKPAPEPICTPTTVPKPKGTPKSSPFTIQVWRAAELKHKFDSKLSMTSDLCNNIPKQILHVIDSIEPIKDNDSIKHYLSQTDYPDNMGNRTKLYYGTIKDALGVSGDNRDIETQKMTTMITKNPNSALKEPQPNGIANKIDKAFQTLRELTGCNLRLKRKKDITLQTMFKQNKGTYLAFLRVKWRDQDRRIPRPPNQNDYYLQIARYYAEEKLFIPGNDHGYGFKLTSNNTKSMTNILRQLNTRDVTTTCKVKGLYPIRGCPQASRKIEPGAVYEVVQTTALDEHPDSDDGANDDEDASGMKTDNENQKISETPDSQNVHTKTTTQKHFT